MIWIMASPDYIVDIEGLQTPGRGRSTSSPNQMQRRSWLSIHWKCCMTYSRIYPNNDHTAYQGRCPRCYRPVRVGIGPGGTSTRLFQAE